MSDPKIDKDFNSIDQHIDSIEQHINNIGKIEHDADIATKDIINTGFTTVQHRVELTKEALLVSSSIMFIILISMLALLISIKRSRK